ncbi:MAG TPA: hypothetical protein VGV89_10435 [Thermoplasmata archaeon]|nr:hypothetical protein [Thermoplasmata archaeon]
MTRKVGEATLVFETERHAAAVAHGREVSLIEARVKAKLLQEERDLAYALLREIRDHESLQRLQEILETGPIHEWVTRFLHEHMVESDHELYEALLKLLAKREGGA